MSENTLVAVIAADIFHHLTIFRLMNHLFNATYFFVKIPKNDISKGCFRFKRVFKK